MNENTEATRSRSEDGFTLFELIIAMMIIGIILVAIGFGVTQGFEHSSSARHDIDRANVTRFASRYFGEDVASSMQVPTTTGTPPCGTGTTVAHMAVDPAVPTARVAYVITTDADGTDLVRRKCTGATTTSETRLGRTYDAFTATVACGGATCALTIDWTAPSQQVVLRGYRRVTTS